MTPLSTVTWTGVLLLVVVGGKIPNTIYCKAHVLKIVKSFFLDRTEGIDTSFDCFCKQILLGMHHLYMCLLTLLR